MQSDFVKLTIVFILQCHAYYQCKLLGNHFNSTEFVFHRLAKIFF